MEKQAKAARELFVGNLTPGMVTDASLYQVRSSQLLVVVGYVCSTVILTLQA